MYIIECVLFVFVGVCLVNNIGFRVGGFGEFRDVILKI